MKHTKDPCTYCNSPAEWPKSFERYVAWFDKGELAHGVRMLIRVGGCI